MKYLIVGLVLVLVLLPVSVAAQTATSDSYAKARVALDRSVAAYGGLDRIRAIESYSFRVEGESVHRNQSERPGMLTRTPYEAEFVIDLKNARFRQVQKGSYPGGFNWHQGFLIDGTSRWSFDLIRRTLNPVQTIQPLAFRRQRRWLPQFVVLEGKERASRLRYLGTATFAGRMHEVVSYGAEDGNEVALYLDRESNLLSKFEILGSDRFSGDAVTETIFTGYRQVGGHPAPTGRQVKIAGELTSDFRFVAQEFNAALTTGQFQPPDDLRAVTFPTPPPVDKLGDRVFTVNAGGYNVLVVEFTDHLFVMEAPGGDSISRQAIETIKRTIPGKPIKYLAVTHHHDDHAGGVRTYMAEGATLIATPATRAFFETVSRNRFTVDPDPLALSPRPARFEPVQNGKRVLTDGTVTVELYDIGPGPHAEEMLVAYLPNEKIVFQGDLLNRPPNGDYPIANETTAHFARWLKAKNLVVERIVPVHGTVTTMEELQRALDEMAKPRS